MANTHQVVIDPALCTGCWGCALDCPNLCLSVKHGTARFQDRGCIACGHCMAICPKNAITLTGFDLSEVVPISDFQPDPDALLESMKSRRSVRRFQDKPVDRNTLEKLIQAGRYSATARNRQGLRYTVLADKLEAAEAEAVLYFRDPRVGAEFLYYDLETVPDDFFFKGAPAVILISGDTVDAALAASKMETLAQAMGLGAFYCGFFVFAARGCASLRELLGLSEKDKPAVALVLGYPAIRYHRTAPREPARVDWL